MQTPKPTQRYPIELERFTKDGKQYKLMQLDHATIRRVLVPSSSITPSPIEKVNINDEKVNANSEKVNANVEETKIKAPRTHKKELSVKLSVREIRSRLKNMSDDEKADLLEFEKANKNRKSVIELLT